MALEAGDVDASKERTACSYRIVSALWSRVGTVPIPPPVQPQQAVKPHAARPPNLDEVKSNRNLTPWFIGGHDLPRPPPPPSVVVWTGLWPRRMVAMAGAPVRPMP